MIALPQCGQIISPGSSPSAKASSSDGYSWSPSGLLECGLYVLNREFGVEFHKQKTAREDLAPSGAGVQF